MSNFAAKKGNIPTFYKYEDTLIDKDKDAQDVHGATRISHILNDLRFQYHS